MVTPSPTLLLAFSHGYALSYSPAWFYLWLHSLLLSCLLLVMVTPSPTLLLAFIHGNTLPLLAYIHGYTLSHSPTCFYSWFTPPPTLLLAFIHGYTPLSCLLTCTDYLFWSNSMMTIVQYTLPPLLLSISYASAFFVLMIAHTPLLSHIFLMMIKPSLSSTSISLLIDTPPPPPILLSSISFSWLAKRLMRSFPNPLMEGDSESMLTRASHRVQ